MREKLESVEMKLPDPQAAQQWLVQHRVLRLSMRAGINRFQGDYLLSDFVPASIPANVIGNILPSMISLIMPIDCV